MFVILSVAAEGRSNSPAESKHPNRNHESRALDSNRVPCQLPGVSIAYLLFSFFPELSLVAVSALGFSLFAVSFDSLLPESEAGAVDFLA